MPRVRDGSYFPSLLQPPRRAERALSAVVQEEEEAYVHGVSTHKVDEQLVKALGMGGISKSGVSSLCEELDEEEEVERFRGRPLEDAYPYVWIDATSYVTRPARTAARDLSGGGVIAVGVRGETGERQVFWAWTLVPARMRRSGPLSCARWSPGGFLRGVASDQRRPPGAQKRHREGPAGHLVAQVPGVHFHAQRPFFGPQGSPEQRW